MLLDDEQDEQVALDDSVLAGLTMDDVRQEFESMFVHPANARLHDLLVRKRELDGSIAETEMGMAPGAEVLLPDFDGWQLSVADKRLELRDGGNGRDRGVRLVIRYAHLQQLLDAGGGVVAWVATLRGLSGSGSGSESGSTNSNKYYLAVGTQRLPQGELTVTWDIEGG